MTNVFTKKDLKFYKQLKQKKYREEHKMFLIEGDNLIQEALKIENLVVKIISFNDFKDSIKVAPYVIKELSHVKKSQGTIAICNFLKQKKSGTKILALENINDPGNLGTLIRSAVAFGFTDVIIHGIEIYNEKVIRSSQGALFKINLIQSKNFSKTIDENKDNKIVMGTHLNAKSSDYNKIRVKDNFIIILGNEAQGITKKTLEILDKNIIIPIQFESLNVAVAGSIIMAKLSGN